MKGSVPLQFFFGHGEPVPQQPANEEFSTETWGPQEGQKGTGRRGAEAMSRLAIVAGAIVLILAVLALGDSDPVKPSTSVEDVRRETAEALQAARAYVVHQREEYRQKVGAKLAELAKGIATLQAKAGRAGAKGEAELNAMIADLQVKQEATRRHFEELKAASGEAWADLKVAMETAMKDLEMGYERARARFAI
jgi:hypothetical protein